MPLTFDEYAQTVVDAAKRATPDGVPLGIGALLAAAVHDGGAEGIGEAVVALRQYIPAPKAVRKEAGKAALDEPMQAILSDLARLGRPVTVEDLLHGMLTSIAVLKFMDVRGVPNDVAMGAVKALTGRHAQAGAHAGADAAGRAEGGKPGNSPATPNGGTSSDGSGDWRTSPRRADAIRALGSFGRMLTESPPPSRGTFDADGPLRGLITTLSKMGRHNAIVVGHPGTGKTAIIYELARRMARQDPALPPRLRDMDIFELSPAFLRSGASVVGQYEERIKQLLKALREHPKIILFVDEIHSMFQSGMHGHTPWTEGNEAFKGVLSRGEISCIGATTWSEYRHYIEPDGALARRFDLIRMEPPSAEKTVEILRSRLPRLAEHFAPLRIDEGLLPRVVELTEEYLPSRYQPDKAIQLLDQACALAVTADPPREELSEQDLFLALDQAVGHKIVRTERLTEEGVLEQLKRRIVGQDAILEDIARAFAAGLGQWKQRKGPRGIFLFGGPTGVGKTEVAVMLSRILGGERDALLRIDCNALQPVGSGGGSGSWRLLGVPEGFVGYARGQGGLLSRIRDMPECVVLFDEFEKAAAEIGEVLLRILDEGKAEDTEGHLLDFRRAFVIFTTNAGCTYGHDRSFGFSHDRAASTPSVDLESLHADLRRLGLGQEFLGRIRHTFLFQGLSREAVQTVITRQMDAMASDAELRGMSLSWSPEIVEHLARRWQPALGVRHLSAILRGRVLEQLNLADAHGELGGITRIEIRLLKDEAQASKGALGLALREHKGDQLVIYLT